MRASSTPPGPPPFLDLDADETLTVTQDYFLTRRWGLVPDHTPEAYRSFRTGYRAGAPKDAQDLEPMPDTGADAPRQHRLVPVHLTLRDGR